MGNPLGDVEEIERIPDPVVRARMLGQRLADLAAWQIRLKTARRAAVHELREQGWSLARTGAALGVTAARVQQIARPEPGRLRPDPAPTLHGGDHVRTSLVADDESPLL